MIFLVILLICWGGVGIYILWCWHQRCEPMIKPTRFEGLPVDHPAKREAAKQDDYLFAAIVQLKQHKNEEQS